MVTMVRHWSIEPQVGRHKENIFITRAERGRVNTILISWKAICCIAGMPSGFLRPCRNKFNFDIFELNISQREEGSTKLEIGKVGNFSKIIQSYLF